ncbi:MAG: hypothetical protein K2X93_18290 [Candidatus Obscuribacterales bacterium]|nr:hypothetical protein [Candidatus Obscuribacterales bacterium]
MIDSTPTRNQEPMWPTLLALMAAGGLHAALPPHLALGPVWLLLGLVAGLMLPGEVFHALGKHKYCRIIGYTVISIVTVAMIRSVALLVIAIAEKSIEPVRLLSAATILWITNILVFAVWYWRLDAGGPHKRNLRDAHTDGAFLFPQMTIEGPTDHSDDVENWSPQFIDYLFLAFNTSTALSPTDVPVLSRWAKVLMMIQSALSLTVVVFLGARAVNIL